MEGERMGILVSIGIMAISYNLWLGDVRAIFIFIVGVMTILHSHWYCFASIRGGKKSMGTFRYEFDMRLLCIDKPGDEKEREY